MTESPTQVALITGAARGIGLAVAKRFRAEGWAVALVDIDDAQLRAAEAALADPVNVLELPIPGYLVYYAVQPWPAMLVFKQVLFSSTAMLMLGLLLAWLQPRRRVL